MVNKEKSQCRYSCIYRKIEKKQKNTNIKRLCITRAQELRCMIVDWLVVQTASIIKRQDR